MMRNEARKWRELTWFLFSDGQGLNQSKLRFVTLDFDSGSVSNTRRLKYFFLGNIFFSETFFIQLIHKFRLLGLEMNCYLFNEMNEFLLLCVTAVSVDPRRRKWLLLGQHYPLFVVPSVQLLDSWNTDRCHDENSGIEIHLQTVWLKHTLFLSLPFSQLESLEKKLFMKMFRYSVR